MSEKNHKIELHRQTNIQQLEKELAESGNYDEWYAGLEGFRESLKKFYKYSIGGAAEDIKKNLMLYASEVSVCGFDEVNPEEKEVFERFLREFATYGFGERLYRLKYNPPLKSGDIIDHHIIGYLAPLDFKRIGWGGRYATPGEQIIRFADYFKKRGKRFIYVALPCKGAVYPEIITDIELVQGKSNCIPQWRKMLKEIVEAGVEVVDILPIFQDRKREERNLYLKDHRVSPIGAKIIGEQIGSYLRETTEYKGKIELSQEKYVYYENVSESKLREEYTYIWRTVCCEEQGVKYPYTGSVQNCQIGFIGNCNLAAYWQEGGGILANTAFSSSFPVQHIGRYLPFDGVDDPVTAECLERCLEHDIIIYVGFPSASFVRTSTLQFSRLARGQWFNVWSTIPLR